MLKILGSSYYKNGYADGVRSTLLESDMQFDEILSTMNTLNHQIILNRSNFSGYDSVLMIPYAGLFHIKDNLYEYLECYPYTD